MGKITKRALLLGGVALLASCAKPTKFMDYNGPEVTGVMVYKSQRTLVLLHNSEVLKTYRFELGFAPTGHKRIEGDGRTPEGQYWIDRRNPNSRYHLSIGISYPNARDVEVAQAMGMRPGGDIFIHGTPVNYLRQPDWTAGCIAVTDPEIEEIYAMVRDGTPIWIWP